MGAGLICMGEWDSNIPFRALERQIKEEFRDEGEGRESE
jgi:hypothetical protein